MATGGMAARPWAPIPGPADRTTFFEEQRRNRRRARRAGRVCGLVLAGMGMAISLLISPLIIPGLLGGTVIPPQYANTAFGRDPWLFLIGVAEWFLPGLTLVLLLWWLTRRLYVRSAATLTTVLGARPPRRNDLEELQLCNVVEEMAIAAGIQSPRVVLLDTAPPNAGLAGSSPHDATVLVSRRMLDEFDRAETQGALAHVVASIANGDLYLLYNTVSILEAFGAALAVLTFPLSRTARKACWQLVKFAVSGRGDPQLVGDLLLRSGQQQQSLEEANEALRSVMAGNPIKMIFGAFIAFLLLPLFLAAAFAQIVVTLGTMCVLGPLMAAQWRSRRRLADATAVEFTRNPGGLARALVALVKNGNTIEGQRWADLLFVVGREVQRERERASYHQAIADHQRSLDGKPFLVRYRETRKQYSQEAQAQCDAFHRDQERGLGKVLGFQWNFHPSVNSRIRRLQDMGARVDWTCYREYPVWILVVFLFVLLGSVMLYALFDMATRR